MLKDLLRTDFNNARKSGDIDKRTAIEAVLAAILLKEKAKRQDAYRRRSDGLHNQRIKSSARDI